MMPLLFRIRIERQERRPFRLFLPLFLIWPLLIALSPLLPVAALLLKRKGYSRLILSIYPILFSTVWALSGLAVQVEKEDQKIFLSFT